MTKGAILQTLWDNLPDDEKAIIEARAAEKIETASPTAGQRMIASAKEALAFAEGKKPS